MAVDFIWLWCGLVSCLAGLHTEGPSHCHHILSLQERAQQLYLLLMEGEVMWLQLQRLKVQLLDSDCMFYVLTDLFQLVTIQRQGETKKWEGLKREEGEWEIEWGIRREKGTDPERGENEGEEDNQKTNVCQYRHACVCQSIPLWVIWKGWFLAHATSEALTHLLLHSSASHKASVCSNWLWIKSDWLEVSKINKHNKMVLCVRAQIQTPGQVFGTKREDDVRANVVR